MNSYSHCQIMLHLASPLIYLYYKKMCSGYLRFCLITNRLYLWQLSHFKPALKGYFAGVI